ncbi:type II toxin-antitoxin system PemK/MazF family toxin [Candidatus Oscillochloris fontis]|uniref:type II toxin-antitoxin system PemK/MazF family toxin n=1 Tax=Candidatus Oscillochloris fontis TaxID=2496868 RepID=UPI00101D7AC1|nr:type II toxin-antitoxin system PemK/MazF family toxin [Candidatus Oscillochloris fontis]
MASILRGDIWWADLDPVRGFEQAGTRPVLVISHDVFNARSGTVIALAITSQRPLAGYPLTYPLPDGTLPKPSWVKVSQIRTLSVQRLSNRVGAVDPSDVDEIIDGLNEIIAD